MSPRYYFTPTYTLHHNDDPSKIQYEIHNVSTVLQFNPTQNEA